MVIRFGYSYLISNNHPFSILLTKIQKKPQQSNNQVVKVLQSTRGGNRTRTTEVTGF
jgi:hypothetical protein